jgi:8-oxo-dGTP diphosphatase
MVKRKATKLPPVIKVLAAIMKKDGRFLIAQRKKGDRFEGLWEFPGGKLEAGETPQHCLARELREEFGVQAEVGRFLGSICYSSTFLAIELLAYEVLQVTGAFRLYDHQEIRWVQADELDSYALTEPDRALLEKILRLRTQRPE